MTTEDSLFTQDRHDTKWLRDLIQKEENVEQRSKSEYNQLSSVFHDERYYNSGDKSHSRSLFKILQIYSCSKRRREAEILGI